MALLLVSLLFQELEYDRPSLIHNFAENFFACLYNDNEELPHYKTPLGHYALLVIKKRSKVVFNNQESIVPRGGLKHPSFNRVVICVYCYMQGNYDS